MTSDFLLYGSYGTVGEALASYALEQGLRPLLAGRNGAKVKAQAAELGLDYRVVDLDDAAALDAALEEVPLVMHCAGPYMYTAKQMLDACLRTGTHYLDLTGEIPVYEMAQSLDAAAKAKNIMLMPAVGFDVVPTDCLAVYLKAKLPSATQLRIAFTQKGPGKLPPGTANTMVELLPSGSKMRVNGKVVDQPRRVVVKEIDFGAPVGKRDAARATWGDVFTAYYSTGIPNIENYLALSKSMIQQIRLAGYIRPLLRLPAVRKRIRAMIPAGSTPEELKQTTCHVWGEVSDQDGNVVRAALHGPEAGVVWTKICALEAVKKVLQDEWVAGYQTPAMAFGPDFVMLHDGVKRVDL